ncbi:hypothetical protein Tco_0329368 [Tanacetum coccineum]
MPTFTQTAFSQPAVNYQQVQPNQSIFSQPVVHFQQTQPTQTNQTGQQYPQNPNNVQSQQFQQFQTATISANNAKFLYLGEGNMTLGGIQSKEVGKRCKGKYIVHSPVSLYVHVAVQKENKVRTLVYFRLYRRSLPIFIIMMMQGIHWMELRLGLVGMRIKEGGRQCSAAVYGILCEEEKPTQGLYKVSEDSEQIGHRYGVKDAAAPTHSAFIGAANSGLKLTYSDQQSIVPSVYQTSGRSDNIMKCVLHSFVAENEPDQDMIYEDFDQVDQLEMEELDLKWQNGFIALRRTKSFGSQLIPWCEFGRNHAGRKQDRVRSEMGDDMQFLPSITGIILPLPYKVDIRKHSDKSSDSETYASCDSSLKTKTKDSSPAIIVPCKSKAKSVPAGSRTSSASVMLGDPSTDNDIGIVRSGLLKKLWSGNKENA